MKRLVLATAMLVTWAACQCGTNSGNPCDDVKCRVGFTCVEGVCTEGSGVGGGGTAGGSASVGGGAEGGGDAMDGGTGGGVVGGACPCAAGSATPVCDQTTNTCKTCLISGQGCEVPTLVCDTAANSGLGQCFGCVQDTDCAVGDECAQPQRVCVHDAGVVFDDAGMTGRCLNRDAGSTSCNGECPRGYQCQAGQCVLRGGSGPLQVTLRFPYPEDLDLHLVEPLPDGGTCEVYYAQPNVDAGFPIPFQRFCGAKGWLDLDSNAACDIDNINVENMIWSPGAVPNKGTYIVRVVFYQHCSTQAPIPYEVEVRANGVTRYYCGSFLPGQSTGGNQGAGVTVATFTIQ